LASVSLASTISANAPNVSSVILRAVAGSPRAVRCPRGGSCDSASLRAAMTAAAAGRARPCPVREPRQQTASVRCPTASAAGRTLISMS
jgi:hypothetical protein